MRSSSSTCSFTATPSRTWFTRCTRIALCRQVHGILQHAGCIAVCEVEELERDSFLVGCDAEGGQEHVDQADIAWTS